MGEIVVESAYLGDERSRVSVIDSLEKKVKSDGTLSVPVDSSLLPMVQLGGEIELTEKEVRDAEQQAAKDCGGAADQKCVELKKQEFMRSRLAEKELESKSTAKVIKGRRLTVNVIENGKRKTYEVPEGQSFELGNVKENFTLRKKSLFGGITLGGTALAVLKYGGITLAAFLYALNIILGFYMFKKEGYKYAPYIMAAVAAFVPYSGFVIPFLFFAVRTWIQKMPTPK